MEVVPFSVIMVSAADVAKRAFIKVMLELAALYGLALPLNRDSAAVAIKAAFRKLAVKVHPDKGGSLEDQQSLNSARDKWETAVADAPGRGRGRKRTATDAGQPAPSEQLAVVLPTKIARVRQYRIQSLAVLLTFQKFDDMGVWRRFTAFVKEQLREWAVRLWCATMETNDDDTYHLHLCIQFHCAADRIAETFTFEGVRPNARANDSLGEGWCGKKQQDSIYRAMFYVWANKIGTVRAQDGSLCTDGNCCPAWVVGGKNKYPVSGRWLDKLLRAYKLSLDVYEEYIYLAMDGVISRKKNLDAIRARREELEERLIFAMENQSNCIIAQMGVQLSRRNAMGNPNEKLYMSAREEKLTMASI